MERRWILIGAILAGLGVAAGAFGAHALDGHVTPERVEVFATGARYQLAHGLALLFVGLAAGRAPDVLWTVAGWLFTIGSVVFAGSLYALVLTDTPWLGAVTPLGGVCLLAGWVAVAAAAARRPDSEVLSARIRARKESTGSRLASDSVLKHRDSDRR